MERLNPWDAKSIQAFSFYCCPECVYRSKSEVDFQCHATFNHPEAKEFLERLEGRLEISDDVSPELKYEVDQLKEEGDCGYDDIVKVEYDQEDDDDDLSMEESSMSNPFSVAHTDVVAEFDDDKTKKVHSDLIGEFVVLNFS
jgi:hypothetical protein